MALVVTALRLTYIFLNTFDSFKTLRLPPPSARNGGKPSERAMSARKRNLKGCMTVWVLWACFTLYERLVEPIISIFIPFYNQLKSLFLLFFIVTRAKGAEPVFLHVIRPAVKPYSATLDALSDAVASIAEFMLLLAQVPVDLTRQQYYLAVGACRRLISRWRGPSVDDHDRSDSYSHSRASSYQDSRISRTDSSGFSRPPVSRDASTYSTTTSARTPHDSSRSSTPTHPHQIWHPPASAYDEDAPTNPLTGLLTPPADRLYRPLPPDGLPPVDDEWRQYPAFPSAYPPTPVAVPLPLRATVIAPFAGIREEDEIGFRDRPDVSRIYGPPAGSQQGFRRSLQSPRESTNPDSDGGLSDDNNMKGVHHERSQSQTTHLLQPSPMEVADEDEEMADDTLASIQMTIDSPEASDSDAEDSDDFNLRTPERFRRKRQRTIQPTLKPFPLLSLQVAASTDSRASRSTTLTTTDAGSEFRTRSNSEASAVSDTSSLAGRKRRHSRPAEEEDELQSPVQELFEVPAERSKPKSAAPKATSDDTTIGRKGGKAVKAAAVPEELSESEVSDGEGEGEGPKRQRVADAPGGRAVRRPAPKRQDTDKTIRKAPARAAVSASTRTQPARASSRIAAASEKRPAAPTKAASAGSTAGSGAAKPPAAKRAAVKAKTKSK